MICAARGMELPRLSEAAGHGLFGTPEAVFEFGLDAVVGRLQGLARLST